MITYPYRMVFSFVVIIPILLLISSCMSHEETRLMAIEHEYDGPVNNAMNSFLEAYYRMPNSKEELADYCKEYSQKHSQEITFIDQFISQMEGNTPWDYLSKRYVSFVSYSDSCF